MIRSKLKQTIKKKYKTNKKKLTKKKFKKKKQNGGIVCAGACTAAALSTGISPVITSAIPVSFGALLLKYKKPKTKQRKKQKKTK